MNNYTIEMFVEKAASKSPVPGGGGVSALVGALGMALGSMVGNLTLGKSKYQTVQSEIIELLEKSQRIQDKLMFLIEEDARVFEPLAAAYGLPNGTPEERSTKEDVLQKVLIDATLVPLEIAKWAFEALKLHEAYAKVGTKMAISDVGVGVALCQASVRGAKLNVLINTKMIKDTIFKVRVEKEIDEIYQAVMIKGDEIYCSVEQALR